MHGRFRHDRRLEAPKWLSGSSRCSLPPPLTRKDVLTGKRWFVVWGLLALGGLLAVIAFGSGSALGQSTPAKPAYTVGASAANAKTLYWKNPGDSSITRWETRHALVNLNTHNADNVPMGSWNPVTGSSAATTSATISNLTTDGYYCFELRAVNGNGNGAVSNRLCEHVVAAKTALLSASDVTEGNSGTKDVTVTVNLTAPAPSGGLRVRVRYSSTASQATVKYNCSDLNPATHDICYTDVNDDRVGVLIPQGQQTGTATFKVVGDTRDEGDETVVLKILRWNDGSWASGIVRFSILGDDGSGTGGSTPSAPGAPTGFAAADGVGQSVLTWTKPSGSITKYQYRAKRGGGAWNQTTHPWKDIASSSALQTYTVTGLAAGEWWFRLRAVNLGGNGAAATTSSAATVTAQSTTQSGAPNAPTGVTVTAGPGSAQISWSSGGGACTPEGYHARVYEMTQAFPMVAESTDIEGQTTWFVDELNYPTRHYVEVYAYGCGEESELATTTFWTGGGNSPTAPASRKLKTPAPVRNLSVTMSSGNAVISWKKPADIGARRSKRCAYVAQGGNHASKSIEYNYILYNVLTDETYADEYFYSSQTNLSKTVSASSLPSGIGHLLRVEVSAYSEECDHWSNARAREWWK